MKILLLLLALVAAGGGTPATKTTRPTRRSALPVKLVPATFCRQHNLAPLWALNAESGQPQVLLGCMGTQFRRLELVYESMRRDAHDPQLYHVRGKSRERDRIMPFRGTIRLTGLQRVKVVEEAPGFRALAHYQATGRFQLRESAAAAGSGTLAGTFTMTFSRTAQGLAYMPGQNQDWDFPRPGEGTKFSSRWTSTDHPAPIQIIWATNFMDIADSVIERFRIGDRGVHINPKYARVGWSRYWENDEWWAKAEEPLL